MLTIKDQNTDAPRMVINNGNVDVAGGTPSGPLSVGGVPVVQSDGKFAPNTVPGLAANRIFGQIPITEQFTAYQIGIKHYYAYRGSFGHSLGRPALLFFTAPGAMCLTLNDGYTIEWVSSAPVTVTYSYI